MLSKYKCKVVLCSLIPLPNEQDCDAAEPSKKVLTDIVSRLFVEFNKEIDKFNDVPTPMLKQYLDKGNRSRYPSGQRKIKVNKWYDVHGRLSDEAKQKLMQYIRFKLENI